MRRPLFGLSRGELGFDIGKDLAPKFEEMIEQIGELVDEEEKREKREAGIFVPHWGRKKNRCPPGTKDALG